MNGYSKQKMLNESMDITDEFDDETANKPAIQETKGITLFLRYYLQVWDIIFCL